MKAFLEQKFETGLLQVDRSGSCAGYTWTVEFIGKGGNKNQFEIDPSGLIGDNVTAMVSLLQNGGIFRGPASMEFFRTPETKPQVN